MGEASSTVSITTIEQHKENIIPLATGRSARSLVSALTPLSLSPQAARDSHSAKKLEFENELKEATELDDPLEVWVRYVKWTIETYPSGHSSESGLLQLLERATKEFIHEPHYKNDPRYLKLWIHYIQNFSDAPREHFAFLARNDIGQRLAAFYEEFAAYLESIDRRKQAAEIFQLGMENNARPMARLIRKYDEFQKRLEANPIRQDEPSSPALSAVRPALVSKALPFGGAEGGSVGSSNQPTQQRQPTTMGPPPKPPRQKMTIFSDTDALRGSGPAADDLGRGSGPSGWGSIGTLEHRRKENIQEPRPWAGEILKQQGGGSRAVTGEKLMIFRDEAASSLQQDSAYAIPNQYAAVSTAGKRPEQVVVKLESVYPDPNDPTDEYCFEELRAMNRGCYGIDWKRIREDYEVERRRRENRSRGIEVEASSASVTIAAKLDSPGPRKGKLKKKSTMLRSSSPTMTLHTRAATDEIYEILNKPLDEVNQDENQSEFDSEEDPNDVTAITTSSQRGEQSDEEGADTDWSDDDTRVVRKKQFSMLGETGISYEDETVGLTDDTYFQKFTKQQLKEAEKEEKENHSYGEDEAEGQGDDEPQLPPMEPRKLFVPGDHQPIGAVTPQQSTYSYSGSSRLPFMTPIVEQTESLPPTTARRKAHPQTIKTPSRSNKTSGESAGLLGSSPFKEIINEQQDLDLSMPPIPKLPPPKEPTRTPPKQEERKNQPLGAKKSHPLGVGTATTGAAKKMPLALSKQASVSETQSRSQALVPAKLQGPIIKETQCNPIDHDIRKQILANINPPLKTYEGYYYHSDLPGSGKREIIQRFAKNKKENGDLAQPVYLEFKGDGKGKGDAGYTFKRELGKGTYAPVYLVENNTVATSQTSDDYPSLLLETRNHKRKTMEAIKIELNNPPYPWEFYILRSLHRRLGISRPTESIVTAHELHLFQKEMYMILEYKNHGSILDAINLAKSEVVNGTGGSTGGAMDELVVMWLSIELLRTVEAIHFKGIIHGDLKADNCLVRFDVPTTESAEWGSKYKRDGSLGWNQRGIMLIDFGMGIDMKCFPEKVAFIADWEIDAQQHCMEIKEMRPWTYQIDYYGLAGIIHLMLFGKYMEVNTIKEGGVGAGGLKTYKIQSSFKRYWQGETWGKLFDILLNPNRFVTVEDKSMLPATKAVREIREEMEAWLEGNAEKGMGLKNLVKRMEMGLRKK